MELSNTDGGRRSVVSITETPIQTQSLVDAVRADECGAISTFEGTTRNSFNGKPVVMLEYEAYAPMALKEMMKLCGEARSRWPGLHHIAMTHRTGIVPIRESSIVIAVSSPHRRDAIAGCEWLIDELKARVPIWKKEHYVDGSVWKANSECCGPRPGGGDPRRHVHDHEHNGAVLPPQ